MKKILTVAVMGVLVAAAGCSDKGENAGGAVKREAGNWKTDVKLVKFEVPGMAPEMKTQMTAPWPTACAAMNAKMQAGTMLKCSV